MNYNKIALGIIISIVVIFTVYYASQNLLEEKNTETKSEKNNTKIELPVDGSLFTVLVNQDLQIDNKMKTITYSGADFKLNPELTDLYNKIGLLNEPQNTVVVYPAFTEAAYGTDGFYDYYKNKCDLSCLTVKVKNDFTGEYSSSRAAFNSLRMLGYQYITDINIEKDPSIIEKYDKVILLHNEYVTRNEFAAITNHPKVLYLYPNALYAEVAFDQTNNTITLVRGHGYPTPEIANGFDWKFDNSELEYDNTCASWKFYEVENGIMLNCYPEYVIFKNESMLQKIKDY